MERRNIPKLSRTEIEKIAEYTRPGVITAVYNNPELRPTKGTGKHSFGNAIERRRFFENASPVFLYTDAEALRHRRNHNKSIYKPLGHR